MSKAAEGGRSASQVILGVIAALVSIWVVLGSLMMAFTESNAGQALGPGSMPFPTSKYVTSIPDLTPTLATLTPTVTLTLEPSPCGYPADWRAYTVQAGDTLESLAQAYGVSLESLIQGNCLAGSELQPGMLVYVPPPGAVDETDIPEVEASATASTCVPPRGWVEYRVQRGDYLLALARLTGTTAAEIMAANCLNTTKIFAGQMLYLPHLPPTATPEPTPTVKVSTPPASAQLSLTKTANTASYDQPGDSIGFSYQLENTGNVPLAGPFTVSDNKNSVSCPAASSLAPGSTLACTGSYSVSQADLDAGSVTNTATAHAVYNNQGIDSNPASQTVNAVQLPGLSLDKTSSSGSYSAPGNSLSYSYQLTNTGNVTLSGPFSVSDDRVSVSCPGSGSLSPGDSLTCSASYTVTQADLDAGSVTNTASAQGTFQGDPVGSNTDSVTVNASQNPSLSLTKSATPTVYNIAGDLITYSYDVRNEGNVTLQGPVTVSDNRTVVGCPNTGSLAPGSTVTCTANYAITQPDVNAGQVTNTATASATFNGNTITSPAASATVNGP